MIFGATSLAGVLIVELERLEDERGYFARAFCAEEFRRHGLAEEMPQLSVSFNRVRGTLRGLHLQEAPSAEAKLIRCTRGAVFDVAVDVRPDSPTRGRWVSVELNAETGRAIYVPEGFAHGFQTLEDGTELLYHISRQHDPERARGFRWDDPRFGIAWPLPVSKISERDRSYPDFDP